ncbi:hypothetical protein D3C77_614320 [compost metagenome]
MPALPIASFDQNTDVQNHTQFQGGAHQHTAQVLGYRPPGTQRNQGQENRKYTQTVAFQESRPVAIPIEFGQRIGTRVMRLDVLLKPGCDRRRQGVGAIRLCLRCN